MCADLVFDWSEQVEISTGLLSTHWIYLWFAGMLTANSTSWWLGCNLRKVTVSQLFPNKSSVFIWGPLPCLQHCSRCDRQMGVTPLIPAWFSESPSDAPCADTLLTDGLLQSSSLMEPLNRSCQSFCPSSPLPPLKNMHFSQVTACGRYSPAVEDSISLWHYDCVFTAKCWHRWTQRYFLFHYLQSTQSVLDSKMLCNSDTFGTKESFAIIHYVNAMTTKKRFFSTCTVGIVFLIGQWWCKR